MLEFLSLAILLSRGYIYPLILDFGFIALGDGFRSCDHSLTFDGSWKCTVARVTYWDLIHFYTSSSFKVKIADSSSPCRDGLVALERDSLTAIMN